MSKMQTCIRHVEEIEIQRFNPIVCGHCQREELLRYYSKIEAERDALKEAAIRFGDCEDMEARGWFDYYFKNILAALATQPPAAVGELHPAITQALDALCQVDKEMTPEEIEACHAAYQALGAMVIEAPTPDADLLERVEDYIREQRAASLEGCFAASAWDEMVKAAEALRQRKGA